MKTVKGYRFTKAQADALVGLGYNTTRDIFGVMFAFNKALNCQVHITCGGQFVAHHWDENKGVHEKVQYFWSFEKLVKKLEKVS